MPRNADFGKCLDDILSETDCPKDFDLLSIDIDSFDLDVWEDLKNYKPKVVVIEINSSIAPGILSRHSALIAGNSFSSTLRVAEEKGYKLVAHTGNMIFVREDLYSKVDMPERFQKYPELFFDNQWIQTVQQQVSEKVNERIEQLTFISLVNLATKKILARLGLKSESKNSQTFSKQNGK